MRVISKFSKDPDRPVSGGVDASRSRTGLSLVEVLLACAILGLVLPAFLSAMFSQVRVSEHAGAHQFATATARRIIERSLQCEFPVLLASCGPERPIPEDALAGFAQTTERGSNIPRHGLRGTLHIRSVAPGLVRLQVRIEAREGDTRPASRVELVRYVSDTTPARNDGGTE